jgi:hypothetical protein
MRLDDFINEKGIPELKDGEYAVPMAKKEKVRAMNKRTNRMKNFKRNQYYVTDVKPEDRSFKNLPRYADKTPKCTFTQWLGLKGGGSDGCKGTDGKYYGWSHRAVYGFAVGDTIKGDSIGNKYQYSDKATKEYSRIADKDGYEEADKYYKSLQDYEPYTIKTEEEAKQHAIRFGRDVS